VTIFALLALCGAASANRLLWSVSGPAEAEGGGAGYTDPHWSSLYVYYGGTTNASDEAVDHGPNGLDATASGSPSATGGVYVLSGTPGECYDIGTVEAISCPRTYSYWASFTTMAYSGYNLVMGENNLIDYVGFRDVGDIRIYEAFNGTLTLDEIAGLDDGAWRMFTVADDGTNAVLYVDGIQTASEASFGGTADIEFFGGGYDAGYFVFEGYLDEFRCYTNVSKSSNEVWTLYQATLTRDNQPVGN